jgi:ABC-type uncharacterized transport system involved in gliding motility auxiliary subunit
MSGARLKFQQRLFVLLLSAAALLAGGLALSHRWQADWTAAGRHSLSPASRQLLAQLDGPIEAEAWLPPDAALTARVRDLFARYGRAHADFSLRIENPETNPARARELNIAPGGELILRFGGREQRLQQLSEQAVSGALAQLSRGGARRIRSLVGHGERAVDGRANGDLSALAAQLASSGLLLEALDLAREPRVPDDTDLLLIADPRAALFPGEQAAISDWLGRGGNLLWLLEPNARAGSTLLEQLTGIRALPGVIVDAASQRLRLDSPDFALVSEYPSHPITAGLAQPTLFPQAAALAIAPRAGWTASELLRSGTQSWSETGEISGTLRFEPESGDSAGPLPFALALERGAQRIVVIGDADFAANAWLGNGDNAALARRLIEWLAGDSALVHIERPRPADLNLLLDDRQRGLLGGGLLFVLPGLLLLLAGLLWRRRRRG